MEVLLIIALGVWVWLQHQRLGALTNQVRELEWRMGLGRAPEAALAPAEPPIEEDLPVAANDEPEPLLLDTPLPPASNDEYDLVTPQPPREEPVARIVEPTHQTTPQAGQGPRFEQWLAENGLAWIGGGALALGAAFLVAFAAQQGFFTPPMRLLAAAVLGMILIAASEWVRRAALKSEAGNALVGALLAGAGAATLYITIWAAHGLYHYIDGLSAAVLLTLCAALLITLSNLHGQALGALAIGAALLAPALTEITAWPSFALTLFICLVAASGFALAALRRWAWTAITTLVGLYVWFAICVAADEMGRALALLTVASLGGAALALRPAVDDEPLGALTWRQSVAALPTIAICIGSVFMLWTWLSAAPLANASPAGPAFIALFHAGLAALAVRRRVAHPAAFAVAAGALVLGLMTFTRARAYFAPGGAELFFWPLITAGGLVIAALAARPHRDGRTLIAGAGAIGAALLIIIAAFSRPVWMAPDVWGVLLLGAIGFVGAAWFTAGQVAQPQSDWSVDLWLYGAAALTLIGLESLAPTMTRPAADAAAALAFAGIAAWRGWRGAGIASLSAAALAFMHAGAPDFAGAVMSGQESLGRALLFLAAAVAFTYGASVIIARKGPARAIADSLSSAAILLVLLGLFLALRWVAAGNVSAPLDAFSENALRALMLTAAGYILLPRGERPGAIVRVRAHVFLASGLLMTLFSSALLFHPWWGEAPTLLTGPPVLNANAFAFLAPAALAIAAARTLYSREKFGARAYASAGALFSLIWAISEIRFVTHGADMSAAEIGLLEGDCYGLVALLFAVGIAVAARLRARTHDGPFTQDLAHIMRGCAFAGLGIGALFLLLLRNPWWGAQNPALSGDAITALAIFTQALAVGLSLLLGRALSRGPEMDSARFAAACGAVLFALTFGHDAIRWLHHRGAMDDNAALMIGLEGFGHALWPLTFVLGGAWLTRRAPGRDTIRHYLYDLQAIWAAAIWPALIWAAFGLWFVFNPWWGSAPVYADTWLSALIGLASLIAAAWLSIQAPRVPRLQAQPIFARIAGVIATGHLFMALSLIVRRAFHGADMRAVIEGSSLETWSYSALWAVFGAAVWAWGARRHDSTLRWSGLALLLFVTGKVIVFDTATLGGVIRAASVIGLAVVLILVALAARRFGAESSRAQGSRE